jgi:cleavage and polyadenylation specificity factor subunit 4
MLYLTGFCPKGETCQQAHPTFDLAGLVPNVPDSQRLDDPYEQSSEYNIRGGSYPTMPLNPSTMPYYPPPKAKTLNEVTCFKCGEKGHFANLCPKRRKVNHSDQQHYQGQQGQYHTHYNNNNNQNYRPRGDEGVIPIVPTE